MDTNLAPTAINLAIRGNWHEALNINLQILGSDKNNIDALNRLARCYSELEQIGKARETAQKVLQIDPNNQIAQKCITKYKNYKKSKRISDEINPSEAFLEEPGKTKIIELLNLGSPQAICSVNTGDLVSMVTHSHKVSVMSQDNKYLGRLPDDLAVRIRSLIKSGNKYMIYIKSSSEKAVIIFVKEVLNKTKNPSFPQEKIDYVSYTPPELVYEGSES